MQLSRPCRLLFGIVKPSLLPSILKYEGSQVQHVQHQYKKDWAYIQSLEQKKSKLNLERLFRVSDRTIMIREFLFEEPTSGVYVIPEGKGRLTPVAVWGKQASQEYLAESFPHAPPELEEISKNIKEDTIKKHEQKLRKRFMKYYESQGRIKKELDLNEELDLLGDMSNEEFEKFLRISSE